MVTIARNPGGQLDLDQLEIDMRDRDEYFLTAIAWTVLAMFFAGIGQAAGHPIRGLVVGAFTMLPAMYCFMRASR